MDVKNIRRPLTNTMLMHGESLAHPVESKPLLHTRPEAKSITSETQPQEDKSRKMVGLPDVKLMQTETNYDNGKYYSASNYIIKSKLLYDCILL